MKFNKDLLFKKHYGRVALLTMSLLIPLLTYTNCSEQRFASTAEQTIKSSVPSGSFRINNGDTYTNDVGVKLQIDARNAVEVSIKNDECPAETASFQELRSEMAWVLKDNDGGSPVQMRFRDKSGAISDCVESSIILDRKAPEIEFLSGADKVSSKTSAAFDVKATDAVSGVDKLYCRLPGLPNYSECRNQFNVMNITEGSKVVTVYAEDKAGNKSDPQEYSFLVDLTAPTVMIKNPLPQDPSTMNSAIVNFEGSDSGSGIDKYLCVLNNVDIPNCQSPAILKDLADGNYVFAVKAVDKVGLVSEPASVTFKVDTKASGDFQILGVTGGSDVKVDAFLSALVAPKIHFSASRDAQSYNVSIYNANNTVLICLAANISGASVDVQFNSSCVLSDNTQYVARASAFRNGLETPANNFPFIVDASGPVITVGPVVKDDEKKTANITFSIVDAGSGVKDAVCYKKYKTDIRMDDCKGKTSISYTNLPEGEHEFYIVANDQLDHSSQSTPVKFSMQYVVCDPFNLVEGKCQKGLKGNLYYASAADRAKGNAALNKQFDNVGKLISGGLKSNAIIYLPFLDVRTRNFTEGFGTNDGGKLKDDAGNVLDEWFALDLESVIKLGDADAEGYYQFALVSDDGSNLFITDSGTTSRRLINNDGIHSTRVGCADVGDAIYMTKNSRFPIRVQYYQGPRTEIAVSLFWRRVATKDAARSTHCGRTDNTSAGATAIVGDGYKPLNAANFILAEEIQ